MFIFKYQERRWMIMIKNEVKILIILVCFSLLFAPPVTAAINTISQGNVIFIGEEGLDISAAMGPDTQIGWWASAADIQTTSPTTSIDLKNRISSFMVSQYEFSGYLGNWYRLNSAGKADGAAFNVADPRLDIKVEDTTVQVDVETLKWIPTGDDIRFKIDSNLAPVVSQRSSPALVTIKVQGPDGGVYTSLLNAGGMPTSVVDIPITTTPFYTGSIWNMGHRDRYPPGNYTIWAECNMNKMNDNYGVTGKTVSRKITILNQGRNPLITKPTTAAPTQVSPRPTTILPTQTSSVTTVASLTPSVPSSTTVSASPTPSPAQTRAPGFEAALVISALCIALIYYQNKE
jgi:hypothetical protein